MGSVKDNFRLSGRREESQREVKEPDIGFRDAGVSPVGSGAGWLLLCTGTAGDGVVCSGSALKSMSVGLGRCGWHSDGIWLRKPVYTHLSGTLSLPLRIGELASSGIVGTGEWDKLISVSRVPRSGGAGTLVSSTQ